MGRISTRTIVEEKAKRDDRGPIGTDNNVRGLNEVQGRKSKTDTRGRWLDWEDAKMKTAED